MLSAAQLENLIEGFRLLDGGLEHQVYYLARYGRVYKITRNGQFGYPFFLADYLRNLVWCNQVFGDDVRLEGVTRSPDGVALVISQPYVHGQKPSDEQIASWFTQQGCTRLGKLLWKFPNGMIVGDAHAGNIILTSSGEMVPIDLHIEKLSS